MGVDRAGRPVDEVVEKVVALVTRGEGPAAQLLVFRHPLSGVQLPAGTVERGEAVETALLREVREETGLDAVRIGRKLAVLDEPLPADDLIVTERVVPRSAPHPGAPSVPGTVRRGMGFTCWEERDGFARIAYRAADMAAVDPGGNDGTWAWIPTSAISRRVRRHVYHVHPTEDTPDEWLVRGAEEDLELDFALFWAPLWGDSGLIGRQASWLDAGRRFLLAPDL